MDQVAPMLVEAGDVASSFNVPGPTPVTMPTSPPCVIEGRSGERHVQASLSTELCDEERGVPGPVVQIPSRSRRGWLRNQRTESGARSGSLSGSHVGIAIDSQQTFHAEHPHSDPAESVGQESTVDDQAQ
jgi:hypothetical protein